MFWYLVTFVAYFLLTPKHDIGRRYKQSEQGSIQFCFVGRQATVFL